MLPLHGVGEEEGRGGGGEDAAIFPRGCGPDAGRGKNTLTSGFLLTQSPDAGRGRVAKDAKGK